ncbi:MAG: hypothetical protein CVT49_05395 [candidate division Zixibacteria bacterium HGW-Zixibacteria-1]|nr:MAG: hypothetical protein CVT49_05395 [candidate division Zixibacteria bacterium HGW-Zixibacteria-1]
MVNNPVKLRNKLLSSINNIICDFQENPYSYLYERDIQCALFAEMRKEISQMVSVPGINEKKYLLNLIYSEYACKGHKERIDLVCLNPDKLADAERQQHKKEDTFIYGLPILAAIEIKYIAMGYFNKGIDISFQDYDKLHKMGEPETMGNKLALCFRQKDAENSVFITEDFKQSNNLDIVCDLNGVYAITPKRIIKVTKN